MTRTWRTLADGRVEVTDDGHALVPSVRGSAATDRVESWLPLVRPAAARYRLPIPWALGIMYAETLGKDGLTSSAGAVGLMQIMPSTAAGYGVSGAALPRPSVNVPLGVRILADLRANGRYDFPSVASMYNAGPSVHGGPKKSLKSRWGVVENDGYISRAVSALNFFVGRHRATSAPGLGGLVVTAALLGAAWKYA